MRLFRSDTSVQASVLCHRSLRRLPESSLRRASGGVQRRPYPWRYPAVTIDPVAPMRILVVEDDVAIARAIGAMLASAGHAADLTERGDTALEFAASYPYDLVILD